MFIESELKQMNALYDDLKEEKIDDYLEKDEIELIKSKGLAYENLRNYVFIPKHYKRAESTVRFQRLAQKDFNLGNWMEEIAPTLRFIPDMNVSISFSFICRIGVTGDKTYMFAAKSLATYSERLSTIDEFLTFAKKMGKLTHKDFLRQAFWEASDQARFTRSGWIPTSLVCNYIWITK